MKTLSLGIGYLFRGAVFLWRTPGLKRYALFPWLINVVISIVFFFAVIKNFGAIVGFATQFIPQLSPDAWYEWVLHWAFAGIKFVLKILVGGALIVMDHPSAGLSQNRGH